MKNNHAKEVLEISKIQPAPIRVWVVTKNYHEENFVSVSGVFSSLAKARAFAHKNTSRSCTVEVSYTMKIDEEVE